MNFQSKPYRVKAEQYTGQRMDGVTVDSFPPFKAFAQTQTGPKEIRGGDFLVTFRNGARVVMTPELFDHCYEQLKDGDEDAFVAKLNERMDDIAAGKTSEPVSGQIGRASLASEDSDGTIDANAQPVELQPGDAAVQRGEGDDSGTDQK